MVATWRGPCVDCCVAAALPRQLAKAASRDFRHSDVQGIFGRVTQQVEVEARVFPTLIHFDISKDRVARNPPVSCHNLT